jgi:mono/diheme cytochrome c family protein
MTRIASVVALLLAALALLVTGCSEGDVSATPETVEGEVPTETTAAEDLPALSLTGDPAAGKTIFTQTAGCGACHTLSDAGTNGTVGPNLDQAKPSYELAVTRVTKGQGGMPSFADQLSAQQIADVAQYVVDSTGG